MDEGRLQFTIYTLVKRCSLLIILIAHIFESKTKCNPSYLPCFTYNCCYINDQFFFIPPCYNLQLQVHVLIHNTEFYLIFCLFKCHVSIIPIYSCMENRNLKEFSKTLSCAIFLCVITYTGTAAFGYFTFGELVTTDILLSYDPDPEVLIAVIFIAMKTYTTYPILLFCGRYIYLTYTVVSPLLIRTDFR